MGWALKTRRQCAPITDKHREYRLKKYDEGEQTKKTWNPHTLEQRMHREQQPNGSPLFDVSEYLHWNQVYSKQQAIMLFMNKENAFRFKATFHE